MDERDIAIGLLNSISAPQGSVSISIWYDKGAPYFKVYLTDGSTRFCDRIPDHYNGYAVVVEPMPKFDAFN